MLLPINPMFIVFADDRALQDIWRGFHEGHRVFKNRTVHKSALSSFLALIPSSRRRFVTNSSDRTLRQFNVPNFPPSSQDAELIDMELEPIHRFNDPINRTAWHSMAFSPNGEWLAGGAADAATHKIYIWDISNDGQFATALDGGREALTHLHVRRFHTLRI